MELNEVEARLLDVNDALSTPDTTDDDMTSSIKDLCATLVEFLQVGTENQIDYLYTTAFGRTTSGLNALLAAGLKHNKFIEAKIALLNMVVDGGIGQSLATTHMTNLIAVLSNMVLAITSNKLKASVIKTLALLITIGFQRGLASDQLGVPTLIDTLFNRILSKKSKSDRPATVLSSVYEFLGVVCYRSPRDMDTRSASLKLSMSHDLKQQFESRTQKTEVTVVAGCFKGFDGFLSNFGSEDIAASVYPYIRKALNPENHWSRYEAPISAMDLLQHHMYLFKDLIFKDYATTHKMLLHWMSYRSGVQDIRHSAFDCMNKFLSQIAEILSDLQTGDNEAKVVLMYFITHYRRTLVQSSLEARAASFAVKSYAVFAPVCASLCPPSDCTLMIHDVVSAAEKLFLSDLTAVESNVSYMISFVESFGKLLYQGAQQSGPVLIGTGDANGAPSDSAAPTDSTRTSSRLISCVERMCSLLMQHYPLLDAKYRQPALNAILDLMNTISQQPEFAHLPKTILTAGLIAACSHPSPGEIESDNQNRPTISPYQATTGGILSQPISYADYIPLWRGLLEVRGNHEFRTRFRRTPEAMAQLSDAVYDGVWSAVLDVISRLDISTKISAKQQVSTSFLSDSQSKIDADDDDASYQASFVFSSPKDCHVFATLVTVVQDILRRDKSSHNIDPTEIHARFSAWATLVADKLIGLIASAHSSNSGTKPSVPHSGIFILLSTTVELCTRIGYFKPFEHNRSDNELTSNSTLQHKKARRNLDAEFDTEPTPVTEPSSLTENDKSRVAALVATLTSRSIVEDVICRVRSSYPHEVSVAALQFLFSLPPFLVGHKLDSLLPAIRIALGPLGTGFLPVARAATSMVLSWMDALPLDIVTPVILEVIPLLDAFLITKPKNTDDDDVDASIAMPASARGGIATLRRSSASLDRHEDKALASMMNRKKKTKLIFSKYSPAKAGTRSRSAPAVRGFAGDSDPELERLKMDMLMLIGQVGGKLRHSLVRKTTEEITASCLAWDSERYLVFAVPFRDAKLDIVLDIFLPRTCELALHSSNRQVKISACELLHSLVIFLIGTMAQNPAGFQKNSKNKLLSHLIPVMLNLACDVEEIGRQIFGPLVYQLIHWFTGIPTTAGSSAVESDILLNCLMVCSVLFLRSGDKYSGPSLVYQLIHWFTGIPTTAGSSAVESDILLNCLMVCSVLFLRSGDKYSGPWCISSSIGSLEFPRLRDRVLWNLTSFSSVLWYVPYYS